MNAGIALAGNPNCGKTALFNALTGSRQKVGNYPGVTVERKEGSVETRSGLRFQLLDLPGTYSLDARTPDEEITRDVLLGRQKDELAPRALVSVADATNLERNLGIVLELRELGIPIVLALNMMDLARARGLELDLEILSRELKVPVIPTVAPKQEGIETLIVAVESLLKAGGSGEAPALRMPDLSAEAVRKRFAEVDRILKLSIRKPLQESEWTARIDRWVLHPVAGGVILALILTLLFQGIFTWAKVPAQGIQAGLAALGTWLGSHLGEGPLKSLLVDGVVAGVGSVLVFLPQILILFLFILALEDSGYLSRAAFMMDRLMGRVGLHGRAFIPLLSSYACAIPGIMATRTIEDRRDRLTTILVAPLTTCSARLPVYTLLVGAFVKDAPVWGPLRSQGAAMLGLYGLGIVLALMVAAVLRRTAFKGPKAPLLMELPTYKWPSLKNIGLGLLERTKIFLRRAGTVILSLSVLLWALSSFPGAPADAPLPAIHYSYAGKIGHALEPLIRPIGFDWRIGIALIPGFAAREVMVSALATVYAIEATKVGGEEGVSQALASILGSSWSLATALSLLIWYVIAPQCLSTIAVVRRETNSWKWPLFLLFYLTTLAYAACYAVYRWACWMGWG